MKVFIARLKAKCREPNPQFTLKEVSDFFDKYLSSK